MNREQVTSTKQTRAISTEGPWGLRQPVLVPGKGGNNEVKAFNWDLGLRRRTLELELNQGQILTVLTNRLPCKIYLVEKGHGPRLYVGRYIFSATDTATSGTCAN